MTLFQRVLAWLVLACSAPCWRRCCCRTRATCWSATAAWTTPPPWPPASDCCSRPRSRWRCCGCCCGCYSAPGPGIANARAGRACWRACWPTNAANMRVPSACWRRLRMPATLNRSPARWRYAVCANGDDASGERHLRGFAQRHPCGARRAVGGTRAAGRRPATTHWLRWMPPKRNRCRRVACCCAATRWPRSDAAGGLWFARRVAPATGRRCDDAGGAAGVGRRPVCSRRPMPMPLADRWDALPPALRTMPAVVAAYARRVMAMAGTMLPADAWRMRSMPAGTARWSRSTAAQPLARLEHRRTRLEQWLQARPSDPAALLAVAHVAQQQGH